ncbi:hypothetical protein F2Q68_00031540 [Brassica cretica]|uniref:DUF1204 domain-containing protein n=1 Tax=Brassica cretica TaxID=69181 RepID=A0A8S9GBP0_BRACR|nr:hypothetical protein F2Q68_00031540 [Brassica cretica]
MCLDNCLVGHLGGLGPYPTVSPPSSLVSSVADSANLEVGFARQLFQVYDLTRFLDCRTNQEEAERREKDVFCETTPSKTTPGETTPGETTPSGPPPPAVSSGPPVGPINIESSREDLVQFSERETAEPSVTDGNKKKRSAPDSSASIDAQTRTGSDEPPRKKKKKKEKKKRKKSTEGQSEPIGDAEGHEPVVHEGSSRDAATRAVVESSGSPNIPLEKRKKPSCGSDASASSAKTPSVAPPTTTGGGSASEERRIKFRDRVEFKYDGDTPLAYAPSESRTKVLSDGSMNYVVELYDTALKETISKLKQSDRLVRARDTVLNRKTSEFRAAIDKAAAEQSRLLAGKKAQKEKFMEKFGELKDKFKNAAEKIRGLERERAALEKVKAALEEKSVATALRHLKQVNRLRDSRSCEVTHERVRIQTAMIVKSNHRFAKIRDLEKRRGDFETARSL